METRVRAKKGGEYGVNGEFYEGGKFLPSTQLPKRSPVKTFDMSKCRDIPQWELENIATCIINTEATIKNLIESKAPKAQVEAQQAQLFNLKRDVKYGVRLNRDAIVALKDELNELHLEVFGYEM